MKDGGPAFPLAPYTARRRDHVESWDEFVEQPGMSLRDYFAGLVAARIDPDLADRIVAPQLPTWDELSDDPDTIDEFVLPRAEVARRIACAAYFIADAMLKARDRRTA
jgi:hypothetical protein